MEAIRLVELTEQDKKPVVWTTIVTICPFPIPKELKPGLPVSYTIPRCADWKKDCEVYHVSNSSYARYIGLGTSMAVDCGPAEIGKALINDWVTAQVGYSKGEEGVPDAYPGLFLVDGKQTKETIKEHFGPLLDSCREIQKNWFIALVRIGDDYWKRFREHRSITERMRLAARELGLEREWALDPSSIDALKTKSMECPVCFQEVDKRAIKCYRCNFVLDQERAQLLGIGIQTKLEEMKLGV